MINSSANAPLLMVNPGADDSLLMINPSADASLLMANKVADDSLLTINPSVDDSMLITLFGALGLVILLIILLSWCAKRSGWLQRYQRHHPSIHVVARLSLGARERLMLVDVGEQRMLLGVTANQITCLSQSPQPDADAKEPR